MIFLLWILLAICIIDDEVPARVCWCLWIIAMFGSATL